MYFRNCAAVLSGPIGNLLLFKLSWVLLVVWQDLLVLPALLLQGLSLWLHPAPQALLPRALTIALTGIAVDQSLALTGIFVFPGGALPGWLVVLWLAFALVLTQGLRFLQYLPLWSQCLLGALCGPCSYAAGLHFDAVAFGQPLPTTLALLAALWALLLPLQLRLARGWDATPMALFTLGALLATALLVLPGRANAAATDLRLVGQASFRFLFWSVYEARLYAPAAPFDFPGTTPFVLSLQYQRDFTREQLVEATLQQWQRQGVTVAEPWVPQLHALLPDVKAGDTLSLRVDSGGQATLHHNDRPRGQIDDPAFSLGFAGIWLAESTTEPEFRRQLLGAPP